MMDDIDLLDSSDFGDLINDDIDSLFSGSTKSKITPSRNQERGIPMPVVQPIQPIRNVQRKAPIPIILPKKKVPKKRSQLSNVALASQSSFVIQQPPLIRRPLNSNSTVHFSSLNQPMNLTRKFVIGAPTPISNSFTINKNFSTGMNMYNRPPPQISSTNMNVRGNLAQRKQPMFIVPQIPKGVSSYALLPSTKIPVKVPMRMNPQKNVQRGVYPPVRLPTLNIQPPRMTGIPKLVSRTPKTSNVGDKMDLDTDCLEVVKPEWQPKPPPHLKKYDVKVRIGKNKVTGEPNKWPKYFNTIKCPVSFNYSGDIEEIKRKNWEVFVRNLENFHSEMGLYVIGSSDQYVLIYYSVKTFLCMVKISEFPFLYPILEQKKVRINFSIGDMDKMEVILKIYIPKSSFMKVNVIDDFNVEYEDEDGENGDSDDEKEKKSIGHYFCKMFSYFDEEVEREKEELEKKIESKDLKKDSEFGEDNGKKMDIDIDDSELTLGLDDDDDEEEDQEMKDKNEKVEDESEDDEDDIFGQDDGIFSDNLASLSPMVKPTSTSAMFSPESVKANKVTRLNNSSLDVTKNRRYDVDDEDLTLEIDDDDEDYDEEQYDRFVNSEVIKENKEEDDDVEDVKMEEKEEEIKSFDWSKSVLLEEIFSEAIVIDGDKDEGVDLEDNSDFFMEDSEYPNVNFRNPQGTLLTLRPYQQIGLQWTLNREREGKKQSDEAKLHPAFKRNTFIDGTEFFINYSRDIFTLQKVPEQPDPKGGILADEMGLGKTIQMISLMVSNRPSTLDMERLKEKQKRQLRNLISEQLVNTGIIDTKTKKTIVSSTTLVICPLTIVDQWKNEIVTKTNPALTVYCYQGGRRIREVEKLIQYDVIITTYQTVSSEYYSLIEDDPRIVEKRKKRKRKRKGPKPKSPLYDVCFFRIILDEAHNIKNRKAQQSEACIMLQAQRRWCLTGTPIQNSIDDLHTLFAFLRVSPHGDWPWWHKNIGKPYENQDKKAIHAIKVIVNKLLLRRTKSKKYNGRNLLELPPKRIILKKVKFSRAEKMFYLSLFEYTKNRFESFVNQERVGHNMANILELLLHLRQVCCHPALVIHSFQKKKNKEGMRRFLTNFLEKYGELYKETIPFLKDVLEGKRVECASFMRMNWKYSTKIESLVNDLLQIRTIGAKSVVFSQWTAMLDLVEIGLEKKRIRFVRIDGAVARKDRDLNLKQFKDDQTIEILLISLRAGGLGLNLTWASYVFLLDLWWNPAVEAQAVDRVHRIGQTKEVTVVRYFIEDTVEERIMNLQKVKKEIASVVLGDDDDEGDLGATHGTGLLSRDELKKQRMEELHIIFGKEKVPKPKEKIDEDEEEEEGEEDGDYEDDEEDEDDNRVELI